MFGSRKCPQKQLMIGFVLGKRTSTADRKKEQQLRNAQTKHAHVAGVQIDL